MSHPGFADRIVATSGTAKNWPHGYVRLEGQIRAITTDAAFKKGDYTEQPAAGIEATAAVWLGWSETDLYFPVGDAREESRSIPRVTLVPIPSLWGHPAGAGASPADLAFLNTRIRAFLKAGTPRP